MSSATAMRMFRKKATETLKQMQSLEDFRENDTMVDYIFKIGKSLFESPLDKLGEDWLIATGGRLTGAYAYLGNKASQARAERDVYEQKLKEVEADIMTKMLDEKYKVTEVRAIIRTETAQIVDLVTIKEYEKNNYEAIMSACDRMTSFIQSALRMKKSEHYKGNMQQNG